MCYLSEQVEGIHSLFENSFGRSVVTCDHIGTYFDRIDCEELRGARALRNSDRIISLANGSALQSECPVLLVFDD